MSAAIDTEVTRAPGDPLATCPERLRARYRRTASATTRSYRAAVKLKCLDCCAWQTREPARCEITTCALYAHNRRIFRVGARSHPIPEEIDAKSDLERSASAPSGQL